MSEFDDISIAAVEHQRDEREAIQAAIHESRRLYPREILGVLVQEFPDAGVTDILLSYEVPYGMIHRFQYKGDPPDRRGEVRTPSGLIIAKPSKEK